MALGSWLSPFRRGLLWGGRTLYVFVVESTPLSFVAGSVLIGAGLAVRLGAAGALGKDDALVTDGAYSMIRHPLDLGTFWIGLGFGIAARAPWLTLLFVALFLWLYLPAMERREKRLTRRFGPEVTSPIFGMCRDSCRC